MTNEHALLAGMVTGSLIGLQAETPELVIQLVHDKDGNHTEKIRIIFLGEIYLLTIEKL